MTKAIARIIALLFLGIVAAGVVVAGPHPASAHTERLQSSPAPASQVGGTVDFIDFIFSEPISNMEVTLEGPNGEFLDGEMINSDGQLVRYEMPAISEVGPYLVRYTMVSADGDFTESIYLFDYDPDASQPLRLGDAEVPRGRIGPSVPTFLGIVVGVCLAGLALMYLSGLEKRRALVHQSAQSQSEEQNED